MKMILEMSAAESEESIVNGTLLSLIRPFSETLREREEKNTPATPKQEKPEPVEAPEPVQKEEPAPETPTQGKKQAAPEPKKDAPRVSRDDVQKAAIALMDAGKQAALVEVLKKFSVKALPELPEDALPGFMEALKGLGA